MSNKVSTEAIVKRVESTKNGAIVSFKSTSEKILGILSKRFKIPFDENPGWDQGDKIRISAEKIGGGDR